MTKRKVHAAWNWADGAPTPPKRVDEREPVKLYIEFEGSHAGVRSMGAFLKRVVGDMGGEPAARRQALRLRKLFRDAAEEAGVRDV